MGILKASLMARVPRSLSDFQEIDNLFEVTDALPPVSSPMVVLAEGESPLILSGNKRNKETIVGLYSVILPLVKTGECRLIIFWQGEYRTDVFELKPNKVDDYLKYLETYARGKWVNSPI